MSSSDVMPGVCQAAWGACPEHGNTLTTSGGETWCRDLSCGRQWAYDRVTAPCTEPAAWDVRDLDDKPLALCDGHAEAARLQLVGARIVPLPLITMEGEV